MVTRPADDAVWDHAEVGHDGLVLDVRHGGPADGVPVLLLHGFPQSARSWTATARLLAAGPDAAPGAGVRVLAPDQRGYSPRARPEDVGAYAVEHLVADAVAVLATLAGGPAHVVGHDWGGTVAWVLAATRPDLVRGLVAVSTPHPAAYGAALVDDEDQQRRSAYLRSLRRPAPEAETDLLADDAGWLRDAWGQAVPAEDQAAYLDLLRGGALTPALHWYRAMRRELAATPPVAVPTTYLWSDHDAYFGEVAAAATADHVRGPYLARTLAGRSHWLPDEAPEEVADAVLAQVAATEPRG